MSPIGKLFAKESRACFTGDNVGKKMQIFEVTSDLTKGTVKSLTAHMNHKRGKKKRSWLDTKSLLRDLATFKF